MDTKIGLSLPFKLFSFPDGREESAFSLAFSGFDGLLDFCANNFYSVELRSVSCDADPVVLIEAVRLLRSRSLAVTIHGKLCEGDRFFLPYIPLFEAGLQDSYNITVHPDGGAEDAERMLRDICATIESCGYPARITLENQRLKSGKPYGRCDEVAEIARRIDSPHLTLCFDFGHQLSNERGELESAPNPEFISRVRHTHVHALGESTHFPLDSGKCPLDRNLTELFSAGFDGILSLELSPERYRKVADVRLSLEHSIAILKSAAYQVKAKLSAIDFYKNDYSKVIRQARARFDDSGDCAMLIAHAGYALKLGGIRIAVDISPRIIPTDSDTKEFIEKWLSEFDAIIATHSHSDHYDPKFVSSLPSRVKKILPDFLPLEAEGRITVKDGDSISLGELSITFFEGAHFLDGNGVPEYGFAIKREEQTFVFPADVRDYEKPMPSFERVSALFANLWLGRALALKSYEQYVGKFCNFIRRFDAQKCYVAHLLETSRSIDNMWSGIHLEAVKEELPFIIAPKIGERIEL